MPEPLPPPPEPLPPDEPDEPSDSVFPAATVAAAAAAGRRQAAAAQKRRSGAGRGPLGLIVTVVVIALLLVGAGGFVVWRYLGAANPAPTSPPTTWSLPSISPPPPTSTAPANTSGVPDPDPVDQIADLIPPAQVDTSALTPVSVAIDDDTPIGAVQAFADDVAAGRVDQIAQQCWMWPSSEIQTFFGTADLRQKTLDVLGATGFSALNGAVWTSGTSSLSFNWTAVHSAYACPNLALPDRPTPAQAALIFARLAGRAAGQPINPTDTEEAYPLLCEAVCQAWNFHGETTPPVTTTLSAAQLTAVTSLSQAPLQVDVLLVNGVTYDRVTATDGSTTAAAYFYSGLDGPRLGEVRT